MVATLLKATPPAPRVRLSWRRGSGAQANGAGTTPGTRDGNDASVGEGRPLEILSGYNRAMGAINLVYSRFMRLLMNS